MLPSIMHLHVDSTSRLDGRSLVTVAAMLQCPQTRLQSMSNIQLDVLW